MPGQLKMLDSIKFQHVNVYGYLFVRKLFALVETGMTEELLVLDL